jgi:hypothetical protein
MIGVPVRLHDLTGDDLGIAHLPPAVELGDLVALEDSEYRVVDVVPSPRDRQYPIGALVKVRRVRLECARPTR